MNIGTTLFTKKGTERGNALIIGIHQNTSPFGTIWQIETDFGNRQNLSETEIHASWHVTKDGVEVINSPATWKADRNSLRLLGEDDA
jgi:hypothetical protein